MHFKRKKSNKPLAIALLALVAILVFILVFLLFASGIIGTNSKAAPLQINGNVNGLLLNISEIDEFSALNTTEEQQAYLNEFISYASANNFNSVFVNIVQQNSEGYSVFARNKNAKTLANVSANDELFNKFDPMQYLIDAAFAQNIAVYSVVSEDFISDSEQALIAQEIYNDYSFTGMYYKENTEESIGFLQPLTENTTILPYTNEGAWANTSLVFLQTLKQDFTGFVINDYALSRKFTKEFSAMQSAIVYPVQNTSLLNYTPVQTLAVTYPTQGTVIYTSTCFVMGTSDPNVPLYINGNEIQRTNDEGFFGVLVDLSTGENHFEFTQGASVYTHTITKGGYSTSSGSTSSGSTSSGTSATSSSDGTVSREGEFVIIEPWIASVLNDASNDGDIAETARQGAQVYVHSSFLTYRSGSPTWAYEVSGGFYVLARNTTAAPQDVTTAVLNSATAQEMPEINGEKLVFSGSGTPLSFSNLSNNSLILRFFDTEIPDIFSITGSSMVQSVHVSTTQDGAKEILLTFAQALHGYSVEYENGAVVLYLKKQPQINTEDSTKPLLGVSVLLDAGHGDTDPGALGVGGLDAPSEKDVNLALTIAAKTRLEQLGATVHLTRSTDVFLELSERNQYITQIKPDFFISLHHNSIALTSDANTAMGIECYYFTPQSQPLAQSLVQNTVNATGRDNRGDKWGYYYVARNNICPSVLFEAGFMVNPAEYSEILSDQNMWLMGDAIAQSILDNLANPM